MGSPIQEFTETIPALERCELRTQISTAFENVPRPRFVLRDRDSLYSGTFFNRLKRMGIESVVASPHSPWHNNYIESFFSNLRRECLNHVIVLNRHHLKRVLGEFVHYYNTARTHEALHGDSPDHRAIQERYDGEKIVAIPHLRGLHHHYERHRAA